jgi:hypothetical protein
MSTDKSGGDTRRSGMGDLGWEILKSPGTSRADTRKCGANVGRSGINNVGKIEEDPCD